MNDLTKTEGTAVSTDIIGGVADELTNDDVQQGRLTLMQANSDFVKEEKCRAGSIVNLMDPEIEIAHKAYKNEEAKPLEFMIVGIMKYWVVKNDDTDEFVEKFPGANANELPWEECVDGVNLKRTFHFSYVVLLTEEIEQGIEMPYELAFRSTAVKETRKLNSLIQRMAAKGVSSHQKVFKGDIVQREAKGNTWFGLELGISRDSSEKEQSTVAQYFAEFNRHKEQFMASQETRAEETQVDASNY
jgi:hypothetical protein